LSDDAIWFASGIERGSAKLGRGLRLGAEYTTSLFAAISTDVS
jgi:hypothetical protein